MTRPTKTDLAASVASASSSRSKASIRSDLERGRSTTLELVEGLRDDDLIRQQDPIVSPINWDLPHVGYFEELWLVHALDGPAAMASCRNPVLEALDNERYQRSEADLPDREGCFRLMERTRAASLSRLGRLEPDDEDPLLSNWFGHEMIINHERQHQENMTMALQFVPESRYAPPRRPALGPAVAPPHGMASVPEGEFPMGSARLAGTYDNEWPLHLEDVAAFQLDRAPVSNRDFLRFMEEGGYGEPSYWPDDSWDFVGGIGVDAPSYWSRTQDDRWVLREFDRVRPLPPNEPVWGISWFEATAYARWAGKRLPTEPEWEKAATWDPETKTKSAYPWGPVWSAGRANAGAKTFGTIPIGTAQRGASPVGCHQMIGDVWEWTSTPFDAYPGFEPFPYPEYSQPFFDAGYYVLRGGSFATHPGIARGSFRNWMYPHLRHVFAGVRCAKDVGVRTE